MATWSEPTVTAVEREAKLIAPVDFRLPDLDDLVAGATSTMLPERVLEAVYYDTEDRCLLRAGITLRHRGGEPDPAWTVKLPEAGDQQILARHECRFAGEPDVVPEAAADLVLASTLGRPLAPLLHLTTRRQPVEIRDRQGNLLAEIVDDTVSVPEGTSMSRGFREVEVEIHVGKHEGRRLLHSATDRLVDAGCVTEAPTPKLMRALGIHDVPPPEPHTARLPAHPTVDDLVRHTISKSVNGILHRDPHVRLGHDPEDVHHLRVATRRLRSDLRSFMTVLDQEQIRTIRDDLAWLGAQVGAARDADVLSARLRATAQTLPDVDTPSAMRLLHRLDDETREAHAAMHDAMRTTAYLHLLATLIDLATDPPLLARTGTRDHKPRRVAATIARRPWRRLAEAMHALGPDASDTELHRARILAKRARYASEAVAPIIGPPAAGLAAAIADLQDCLGDDHDAVVAEAWLRRAAAADPASALAAGQLIAAERTRRAERRAEWPALWRTASTKRLHRWLN